MATQENDDWYYVSEANEQLGPVSIRELGSLAARGAITPKTFIWNPAQPEWIPAEKIRDLLNVAKTPEAENHPSPVSRPALLPAQELKPRKASFIFPRLVATCLGAALIGAMVSGVLYGLDQPVWFGILAFIAILLLGIFSAQVAYRKERYQLQGTRLVCHRGGLFSDEATEFEIRNITHVKLKLPWLRYKLFGVGHVIVETAGTSKPMTMRAIRDPEAIYAGMRERMKSNGYDLSQRKLLHEEKPALIGVFGECVGHLVGAAVFFFAFIGGILSDAEITVEGGAVMSAFGVLFLAFLIFVILRFFDLMRRTYRVYNDIVVYEEGFLTRHNAFIPYENIADSNTKRTLIEYAERAGRTVVMVPPAYTTMTCSDCGARAKQRLELSEREFVCHACGLVSDRDRNAARVILARAGLNPAAADAVRHPAPFEDRVRAEVGIPRL